MPSDTLEIYLEMNVVRPKQKLRNIQSRGLESREKIIKAAKKLFALSGYQETSFQLIANAAGLSQSAVLHHFPNKFELFKAVLTHLVENNENIAKTFFDPKDNAFESLKKHFEINYTWAIESDYNASIMTCLFNFATFNRDFAAIYTHILNNARNKILGHIYAGVREGIFKLNITPELAADILHDTLLGFMITATTTEDHRSKAKSVEKWKAIIDAVLL